MLDNMDQLEKVLSDAGFVKELFAAENTEAVRKMLADKGVDVSLEDIEKMDEIASQVADGQMTAEQIAFLKNGELSDEQLEEAAGGSWYDPFVDVTYRVIEIATNNDVTDKIGDSNLMDRTIYKEIAVKSLSKTGYCAIAGAAIAAVAIGYGVYDAVRRRW